MIPVKLGFMFNGLLRSEINGRQIERQYMQEEIVNGQKPKMALFHIF